MMDLEKLTNHTLRLAIWNRRVSFPSQIPVFEKQTRSDIQWRVVGLYFIRRWSFRELGKWYKLTPQRMIQIVDKWRIRAVALRYIQEIPLEEPIAAHGHSMLKEGAQFPLTAVATPAPSSSSSRIASSAHASR